MELHRTIHLNKKEMEEMVKEKEKREAEKVKEEEGERQ